MKPKVSVIVPIYNVEPFLATCLNSIVAQTYTEWECLLIDDGSTDRCGQICDDYVRREPRMKVYHLPNRGCAAARQYGIDHSTGDYIANIDPDDYVEPQHLAKMVAAAVGAKADIVHCDYYTNGPDGEIYHHNTPASCAAKTLQLMTLRHQLHAGLWCKLIARRLFTDYGVRFPPYSYYEDMATIVPLLQYARTIVYLPVATYHWCYNPHSYTNEPDLKRRLQLYGEFTMNMEWMNTRYGIAADAEMRRALDDCVNGSKRGLLRDYYAHYALLKPLLAHFPHSMKWRYCRSVKDLLFLLAANYGIVFPYRLRQWLKLRG